MPILFLCVALSAIPSLANASCSSEAQYRIRHRLPISFAPGLGGMFLTAGHMVALGMGSATVGVSAIGYYFWTKRPHYLVHLFEEARSCQGRRIERLYDRYRAMTDTPVGIDEFCDIIRRGDKAMTFCPDHLPSRNDLIRFIEIED